MPEIDELLGVAQTHLIAGRLEQARKNYQAAVSLDDQNVEAHYTLGNIFYETGRHAEAAKCYRRVLAINPKSAEAYSNLGITLIEMGRHGEAVSQCKQAVMYRPNHAEFLSNLACEYQHNEELQEAQRWCRRVISLKPGWSEAYYNLASVLREQGHVSEAIANNQKALSLRPDFPEARWNLCHTLLLNGQWEQAWHVCDWWRCTLKEFVYPDSLNVDQWDGSDFTGKRLLVHWERGIGDNLQCLRYAPLVKQRGGTVLLEVPDAARDLLKDVEGIDEMVAATVSHQPDVAFDLYVTLLDLPTVFNTTLATIPSTLASLRADPARIELCDRYIVKSSFKIGVVWTGDPQNGNNDKRSCSLEDFAPLARIPGVQLYSLQKGRTSEQLIECEQGFSVIDLAPHLNDFSDTAAVMHHLDLVISVDTAALHLAGTLGHRAWGLMAFAPDWRWLLKRTDCPWYPSLRLFRPGAPGNWGSVFKQVEATLREELT